MFHSGSLHEKPLTSTHAVGISDAGQIVVESTCCPSGLALKFSQPCPRLTRHKLCTPARGPPTAANPAHTVSTEPTNIPVGRAHKGQHIIILIADLDIRVLNQQGQLLRHLTLDPTKNYQPLK